MKRVSQRHDNGCGIACVAIIAGVSYRKARKVIFGKRKVRGTRVSHLRRALRIFNIKCSKLISSGPRRHYKKLRHDAILKVKARRSKQRRWHWIVWDAESKTFIDPVRKKADRYVRPPVRAFLKVYR